MRTDREAATLQRIQDGIGVTDGPVGYADNRSGR